MKASRHGFMIDWILSNSLGCSCPYFMKILEIARTSAEFWLCTLACRRPRNSRIYSSVLGSYSST